MGICCACKKIRVNVNYVVMGFAYDTPTMEVLTGRHACFPLAMAVNAVSIVWRMGKRQSGALQHRTSTMTRNGVYVRKVSFLGYLPVWSVRNPTKVIRITIAFSD